jgi:hypothetical protein
LELPEPDEPEFDPPEFDPGLEPDPEPEPAAALGFEPAAFDAAPTAALTIALPGLLLPGDDFAG